MQFLKFIAAVIGVPVITVLLLVVMIFSAIFFYILWLFGVPINVTVQGKKYRYRWVKRLY